MPWWRRSAAGPRPSGSSMAAYMRCRTGSAWSIATTARATTRRPACSPRRCSARPSRRRRATSARPPEEVAGEQAADVDQLRLDPVDYVVQARLQDPLGRLRKQGDADLVEALEGLGPAAQHVALAQLVQEAVQLVDAVVDRARERAVQEKEAHDVGQHQAARMHAPEGVIAGGRAQQRRLLPGLQVRGGLGGGGKPVELHVHQAGSLVGALDVEAELIEVPVLVAEEGELGDAGMGLAIRL